MKTRIVQGLARRTPIVLAAVIAVAVSVGAALVCVGRPLQASAAVQTVVTIQFDDGNADQLQALDMLNAHGMHATFYVNTGFIGDSAHMSWAQLQTLFANGNDIGGHTLTHQNIKKLKPSDARQQVCQDRDNLLNNGLQPTAFAYPFGSFDAGSEQIVHDCGYNSGRGVSGVNDTSSHVAVAATGRLGAAIHRHALRFRLAWCGALDVAPHVEGAATLPTAPNAPTDQRLFRIGIIV